MKLSEPSAEKFVQTVFRRRLLYLWGLRSLGYQCNDKDIEDLEKQVFSDIPEVDAVGRRVLCQKDIDELQLILSFTEQQPARNYEALKALFIRLNYTALKMYREQNHTRPHFHIEYKKQYSASYAIETLEKLSGNIPAKYEKPIMEWALRHKNFLLLTWNKLQTGELVQNLVFEATETKQNEQ